MSSYLQILEHRQGNVLNCQASASNCCSNKRLFFSNSPSLRSLPHESQSLDWKIYNVT